MYDVATCWSDALQHRNNIFSMINGGPALWRGAFFNLMFVNNSFMMGCYKNFIDCCAQIIFLNSSQ